MNGRSSGLTPMRRAGLMILAETAGNLGATMMETAGKSSEVVMRKTAAARNRTVMMRTTAILTLIPATWRRTTAAASRSSEDFIVRCRARSR